MCIRGDLLRLMKFQRDEKPPVSWRCGKVGGTFLAEYKGLENKEHFLDSLITDWWWLTNQNLQCSRIGQGRHLSSRKEWKRKMNLTVRCVSKGLDGVRSSVKAVFVTSNTVIKMPWLKASYGGNHLFGLQVTIHQRKPRQELKAGTWR